MEQLEYITRNALMECSMGSAPGIFNPTFNTSIKINGCIVATEADKIALTNIPSFIACKATRGPCKPVSTVWLNTYPVKIKGQQALLGRSCMMCGLGGTIKFLSSGQIPLDTGEEAELNSIRENVQKTQREEQKEKKRPWWKKAFDFVVDMVPVVGPVVSIVKNVSQGNWGMAALDVGFLALDVAGLVTAPFTGGGSVAGTTAAKVAIRGTIKAGIRQAAKKACKEMSKAAVKKTGELLSRLSVKSLTSGRLCVFACFPAGTPVATRDGLMNIEHIKVGNEVWAYDENTGAIGLKPVLHKITKDVHTMVVLIINGEIITTTPEHPFYANGEWKEAGLLETGDSIMLFSGRLVKVEQVEYKHIAGKVYNFEVEDWHTYYVGVLKALVHNADICLKQVAKEIKAGKKKLREILLGKTPGKLSKTGKEVINAMRKEGKIRNFRGKTQFKDSKGVWRDLKYADMAHKTDAVKWWNKVGKKYGARSEKVREWMNNSKNYYLEYFKINRSKGAQLTNRYLLPVK